MSTFELIRTEAASEQSSVKRMCRLLEVSRSGYYDYDYVARRLRPHKRSDWSR